MSQTLARTPRVVVIVGPTAVGKTATAVRLARALPLEAISADSRQVYRGMDIGTAKPTLAEQAELPHHLVDVVEPDQELTLAHYVQLAGEAILDIGRRAKLPVLVGGTGLYVQALLEGWTVPEVPPNEALRAELAQQAEDRGATWLHARLFEVDPEAAARIDARNVRRVIRALEVYRETGTPISRLQHKRPPAYELLKVGLTLPRAELYARIDARVDRMMELGLLDEVRGLVARGYSFDLPSMSGLGYKQLGEYLCGQVTLDEAVARIKRFTRRFVRQQYNWFRLNDVSICWLDAAQLDEDALLARVRAFLGYV